MANSKVRSAFNTPGPHEVSREAVGSRGLCFVSADYIETETSRGDGELQVMGKNRIQIVQLADAESAGEMDRVERSDHGWKGFAGALKDSLIQGTDRQSVVDNLRFTHEDRHLCIGNFMGKAHTVDRSQRFDAPQGAAVRFIPFFPDTNWICLPE